jgi:hypothetical protein
LICVCADQFGLGEDAVLGAEVEHLLGLANAADGRIQRSYDVNGMSAKLHGYFEGLGRGSHVHQGAVDGLRRPR